MEKVAQITLEEFMQVYRDQGPFELIEGERIPMTPQITRSARIATRLLRAMADYIGAHHLGEVFMETPFVLTEPDSNRGTGSRVPDLMFVQTGRLAQLAASDPEWDLKPLVLVPDLVVGIVSPTDQLSEVGKKISRYLADGVQTVWLIDPEAQTVTIYAADSKQLTHLSREDTLDGGEIIPGFNIDVKTLFG